MPKGSGKKKSPHIHYRDNGIRRVARTRLLYICIGVIFMLVFGSTNGPARFLALGGLIFSGINLIALLSIGHELIESYFPSPPAVNKNDSKDVVLYRICQSVFFLAIGAMLWQIEVFDTTIGGSILFWHGAFTGLGIGGTLLFILPSFSRTIYAGAERRYTIFLALLLGCFFLTPGIMCAINKYWASNSINCELYRITEKSHSTHKGHTSYTLHIRTSFDEKEKFSVKEKFYDGASTGDYITMCSKTGALGYDIVTEIKK